MVKFLKHIFDGVGPQNDGAGPRISQGLPFKNDVSEWCKVAGKMFFVQSYILIFISSNRLTVLHSITCFQHDLDATKDRDCSFRHI